MNKDDHTIGIIYLTKVDRHANVLSRTFAGKWTSDVRSGTTKPLLDDKSIIKTYPSSMGIISYNLYDITTIVELHKLCIITSAIN